MRSDMSKVITEPPRHGHANPSLKTAARFHRDRYDDDDHGPSRMPVRRFRLGERDGKAFSDLISPLHRFLRSQVGRPWDDVFSEMCAYLDRRTLSGHVWTHVWSYVQRDCWIDRRGHARKKGHHQWRDGVSGLYIHPHTGLLCEEPSVVRRRQRGHRIDANVCESLRKVYGLPVSWESRAEDWRQVNQTTVLERRVSGWFVHRFRKLDLLEVIATHTVGTRTIELHRGDIRGEPLFERVEMRQIGRRDKHLWRVIHLPLRDAY